MIKQTAQQIARSVARQSLNESNEFLKAAREQIAPALEVPHQEAPKPSIPVQNAEQSEANKNQSIRLKEAYGAELEQIRRDNLFKDLQRKIAEGQTVPLEDYINELGSEQREVLKAQMEAVQVRKKNAELKGKKDSLPKIISKKGRGMFNKIKKQNEQHVETRQPPSG
jgi:ABC-type phosphate transport system auxiliary subunit